jgi:hypothetical protein
VDASSELARAQSQLTPAQSRGRTLDAAGPVELAEIVQAQRDWTAAELRWRGGLVELAHWKLALTQAARELAMAEIVYQRGTEIDVAPFRGQQARLHERMAKEAEIVAQLHSALDACARAFAEAKERYAATRRPPAALAARARNTRADGR